MTALLKRAIAVAKSLPEELQDEAARAMLSSLGFDETPFELTPEDDEAVARSREAVARGEFASDDMLRAIRTKHGL